MKKIILLLGICFYVVGVYAQKLETQTLDEKGDSYEVRIKHFNKLFGEAFTPEKVAPLIQEKEKAAQRAAWREKCAKKFHFYLIFYVFLIFFGLNLLEIIFHIIRNK